jgi:hypothetical protein
MAAASRSGKKSIGVHRHKSEAFAHNDLDVPKPVTKVRA